MQVYDIHLNKQRREEKAAHPTNLFAPPAYQKGKSKRQEEFP